MTPVAVAKAAVTVGARALFWCVLHAHGAEPTDPEPFRLYTSPCLHVGLRPHSDAVGDAAVTLQVTACTPF